MILIIRPGAIGDCLLALPALQALRAAWPHADMALVGHPAVGELAIRTGLVDWFVSRDDAVADSLYSSEPALARERLGRLEAAVVWSEAPDERLLKNLAFLGAERLVVAPARPAEGEPTHVTEHLLTSLAPLGVKRDFQVDWRLPTWPPSQEQAVGAARLIVLHPGSGGARKNWPASCFAGLAGRLAPDFNAQIAVLAGPADDRVLADFERAAEVSFNLWRGRPLVELAELLAVCALFVGNDSGMSHLAGMAGAPTIALFGSTDPRQWRPLGPRVAVMRGEPIERLSEAAVEAAARSWLAS